MGYALTSLGNLPIQKEISLYIFVIGTGWNSHLEKLIDENFMEIARRIGPNAVIAKGFDPETWSSQVEAKYLGNVKTNFDVLPALLLTDAHPQDINEHTLRLLIPLRDAERRFGGEESFFQALSKFAVNRDPEFLSRFEDSSSIMGKIWSASELKPGIFGFSINLKKLFTSST